MRTKSRRPAAPQAVDGVPRGIAEAFAPYLDAQRVCWWWKAKKMSKSLGNFFTVRDLLDQGYPGEVIRFVFLSTHYRRPMDWTEAKAKEAEATLRKLRALTADVCPAAEPHPQALAYLRDDLNTAGVIGELHQLAQAGDVTTLLRTANLLGLLTDELGGWEAESAADGADRARLDAFADYLLQLRKEALETKDFSAVDAMKSQLLSAGVEVRMSRDAVDLEPSADFDSVAFRKIERLREADA